MANVTTHRRGEILQNLFRILASEPEGLQAKDAIGRLEAAMELTEFEKSRFPNNPDLVRFPKIVRFATIASVKAGWLRKRSGTWTLTTDGKDALDSFADPEQLFRESSRLYNEWKASQPEPVDSGASDGEVGDASDEGLIAATTLEEAEENARQHMLRYLAEAVNPYDFQDLVGKLLEGMGYHIVWIAPRGKDGGLDLLAQGDPLGVAGPRIKGQVKRRLDRKTTEEELRSFLSLVEPNDVGVYISLGGFTTDCSSLGRRTSRRVTLIDGDALLDLWFEHFDRIDEEGRRLLPVRPVYYLDPSATSG
ncbi:MAG TPA: restriction endonuclease [Solirubrobacterales bacterium]|nr:restriction endonuclease [Solirubrobacterales bacterium]